MSFRGEQSGVVSAISRCEIISFTGFFGTFQDIAVILHIKDYNLQILSNHLAKLKTLQHNPINFSKNKTFRELPTFTKWYIISFNR